MKISSARSDVLVGFLAAVLLILGNSPFFIPTLPFLALALYVWAVKRSKHPFTAAFLIAAPYWTYHSLWITNLSVPPPIKYLLILGVVAMTVVLSALNGLWGWAISRARDGWETWMLAPSLWVALEYFRGRLLMDLAYPWAPLGESALRSPFKDMAAIGGIYLVSFFIVLVGALLYLRRWLWAALVLGAGLLWGILYSPPPPYGHLKVAVLQPNVLPRFSYDPKEWQEVERAYDSLLMALKGRRVDLVVASESAFPGVYRFSERSQKLVMRIVKTLKAPLLFGTAGIERSDAGLRFYNRVLLVDTAGRVVGKYDKVQLVPFGENLPFYEYLPAFLRSINLGQGNYRRGVGYHPIEWDGVKIGVMICYESIFPHIARALAERGANLLVVATSDGWFGNSIGPLEHYHLGIFRSIETGRAMVRAAKTGISAVIDAEGRPLKELGLYRRGVIVAEVPLYSHRTPFVAFGHAIVPLLSLIGALLLGYVLLRRPNRMSD
ncbi:MAG: apolipoprotein N-acyltransferase [Thermotogae bacterium]|nr:apolipoprotein N-acyltransferase [Thermotogota bacterium]